MADLRSVVVVSLILLIGGSVGALAGYRLYVQEVVLPDGAPVVVDLRVTWPDGDTASNNVTLVGMERTAFGALVAAGAAAGFSVRWHDYRDDVYVYAIGDHEAERSCGWLYSVNGVGLAFQPTHASNKEYLSEGDVVVWSWGCV